MVGEVECKDSIDKLSCFSINFERRSCTVVQIESVTIPGLILLLPPGSRSSSPRADSTIFHSPRRTSNDLELNFWFFRLQGGSIYPCLPDTLSLQPNDQLKNHTCLIHKNRFRRFSDGIGRSGQNQESAGRGVMGGGRSEYFGYVTI